MGNPQPEIPRAKSWASEKKCQPVAVPRTGSYENSYAIVALTRFWDKFLANQPATPSLYLILVAAIGIEYNLTSVVFTINL